MAGTTPKRWLLSRHGKQFAVTHSELLQLLNSGKPLSGLFAFDEATASWQSIDFLAAQLAGPEIPLPKTLGKVPKIPTAKPAASGDVKPRRKRGTPDAKLGDYVDAPLDELLYKDKPGLPCKSCRRGVLRWTHRWQVLSTGILVALLLAGGAVAAFAQAVEHGINRADNAGKLWQGYVDEAERYLVHTWVPDELCRRILTGQFVFRDDYAHLSRTDVTAVLNATTIIANGRDHLLDMRFQQWIGVGYAVAGLVALYFVRGAIGSVHVLRCDYCGLVVRN